MAKKAALWIPLWLVWIAASLGDVYLWYWTRTNETSASALTYELSWFVHTYTASLILLQIADLLYRKLHPAIVNILQHLGIVSFGVYIIHAAVLFYYFKLPVSHQPILYCMYIAGGYVFTLLVSWGLVGWMQKYIKNSWLLFGSKPKTVTYVKTQMY